MEKNKSSGYQPCGCRDCFEIAVGTFGTLCWECREAGCVRGEEECKREGEEFPPSEVSGLPDVRMAKNNSAPGWIHAFEPSITVYTVCRLCNQHISHNNHRGQEVR